jgi:hypothetical protein
MAPIIQTTPASHVWWAFRPEAVFDELWSNYIFIWRQCSCHGQVLRHGSSECGPNVVFFSSAMHHHLVAEAQGYAGDKFPRFPDKANHSSGLVSMHTRPWRVPPGICPKVLASQSPHRLWRSCSRRWMSTSELSMTSAKEGRKHTSSLKWPGASEEESTRGMSGQFTTLLRVMTEEVNTEATVFLASFGATKLFPAASSKRQRHQGLRRKVWGSA